jgi:DNA-binding GntR family transcriptional regulator
MSPRIRAPEGLAATIADALAQDIIYDAISPNQRLGEDGLSKRFGTSRSPIREAFRMLAQEGLVVFLPRRGVRVAPLSRRVIREVYECRAVLEGFAAGLAAERPTPGDIRRLKRTYRAMASAARKKDARLYFQRNVELQNEIRKLADNGTLSRLLESLGRQTLRYRYIVYATAPEMIAESVRRNAEIVRAIECGDGARARHLTEQLILEAGESMLKHLPESVTD